MGHSALEARRQAAIAKADSFGGIVFEYVFRLRQARVSPEIRAFSVVKDESELRDRLAVYHVMTS